MPIIIPFNPFPVFVLITGVNNLRVGRSRVTTGVIKVVRVKINELYGKEFGNNDILNWFALTSSVAVNVNAIIQSSGLRNA